MANNNSLQVDDQKSSAEGFNISNASRYFSVNCFNKAWELMEKADRTLEENEEMIRLSQSSLWHWTKREDCKNRNMSVGYWQISRIHAILGRAEEARRYGRMCLEFSRHEPPLFLAYAYEALARAEKIAGNSATANQYHTEATLLAEKISDSDEQKLLRTDLATI